ncbi:MAG: hypothetical protein PVG83_00375 [Acidimicrobiia bacterium]
MSDSESRLFAISRRLAEIKAALAGESREPSPEHLALLRERDALRDEAAECRTNRNASRSTQELEAELTELRKRRAILVRSHTGYATSKGGGSSSPSPGEWVMLAAMARETGELGGMDARISEIESELVSRETGDQPR